MRRFDRKTGIGLGLAVVMLAAAGVLIARYIARQPDRPVWNLEYHCANGHRWTAGLGPKPVCPRCGEPAIRDNLFICFKCRRLFLGYQSIKLDVGQYRYRMPDSSQWTAAGPQAIQCPYCGNRSHPFDFPRPPLALKLPLGSTVPEGQPIEKVQGQ